MNNMQINLYTEHARELLKMPQAWEAYSFEVMPEEFHMHSLAALPPGSVICITGAVMPLITRGEHEGHPNWRKRDRSTDRKAYFTFAEHEAWKLAWEEKTGKCSHCVGEGRTVTRFSATAVTHQGCTRCGGTGKRL